METDLHLEADLFFGPCNDPNCPGAALAPRQPRLELVWPDRAQQRLMEDGGK